MRLMYVFDPRATSGYLCRMPARLARAWVRWAPGCWDYAPTLAGM
jgi:hypothetical protein